MDTYSPAAHLAAPSANADSDDLQASRYKEAVELYGSALIRLVRGYESAPDRRNDLLQEIHIALWRSFAVFDARCSLRTWTYRVAHITAMKHIVANRRVRLNELQTLDELPEQAIAVDSLVEAEHEDAARRLLETIVRLKPLDRQVILLYLEDLSAEAIGEVVGLSPRNIATKIHRIKKLLSAMFHSGDQL